MQTQTFGKTREYAAEPRQSIREAVEEALRIARAINKTVIVRMDGARFGIHPDTTVQKAIDTYLEVLDKIFLSQRQLAKQKAK